MPRQRSQFVDGGFCHRPRPIDYCLAVISFLLVFASTGCKPRETVTLALLGDLMLGRGVDTHLDSLAYLMPELSSADLALSNLESPFSPVLPISNSPYNLCALSVLADLLTFWGIDLVSLANNHNLDCGPDGPAESTSALNAVGVSTIGPGTEVVYREMNGLLLAFLAFDDISSSLDENAASQAIRSARLSGAEVIVSVHWGAEYQAGASDRQKFLAQEFADAGAALIWGHHPHVLQPAAWIGPKPCDDLNPSQGCTLVLYSLGNSLFDQGGLEDTRRSALVLVTMDGIGITSVSTVPFVIDVVNSRVIQPDAGTADKIKERLRLP